MSPTPACSSTIHARILACYGINSTAKYRSRECVSPLFYYEPRVGLAYDIFGTGKTVLRAGFAVFHYQISTQVADAATGRRGRSPITTPVLASNPANRRRSIRGASSSLLLVRRPEWRNRLVLPGRQQDSAHNELEHNHF